MPTDAKSDRQTAWTSLDVTLEKLTDTSTGVLVAVVSLERRIVNHLSIPVKAERREPTPEIRQIPPLLTGIEERVRAALGQLQEAQDILTGIEREISA